MCQSRRQVCTYDAEAGVTRIEALRQRNKELTDQNADYELVFMTLRNLSEADSIEHLLRLRISRDVESYADVLRPDQSGTKRRRSSVRFSPSETTGSSNLSQDSQQVQESGLVTSTMNHSRGASNIPPAFVENLGQPINADSDMWTAEQGKHSSLPSQSSIPDRAFMRSHASTSSMQL